MLDMVKLKKPNVSDSLKDSLQDNQIDQQEQPDPNVLLNDFLIQNNLKINIEGIDGENPFIGNGFILTDRPILKISVSYN